jgi:hypothetical protein
MIKKQTEDRAQFKILCITCGVIIRKNASDDSYGLCLKCFYRALAARLRSQKRASVGEFVSDR